MQDIANELGITKVSVSKALSGQPGISANLREKTLRTAERMGYIWNPKRNQKVQTYTVGFVVTKRFFLENDRFYHIIYYHMNKLCISSGHKLILLVLSEQEENQGVSLETLCKEPLDGIFLAGQIHDTFIQNLMRGGQAPVVALDFYRDYLHIDTVLADNYQLGYQAAMQMIACGHRHIGFVGDIFATSSISDRFFGYIKALASHDLPIRKEWFLVNNNINTGHYAVDIELPAQMPTGFVCHCDMAAYYLCHSLRQNGFQVPEHVSLVAFDHTDIAHTVIRNLATFDIGRHSIAETAFRLMLGRLAGSTTPIGKHYVQSTLIPGDSIRTI